MTREERYDNHRRGSGFASGVFWGVVLGSLGMLIFATKKGKKLREYLKEHGQGIVEEIEEIYEELDEKDAIKQLPKLNKKTQSETKKPGKEKDVSHIQKLQEHGRNAVRYFTRSGKPLK